MKLSQHTGNLPLHLTECDSNCKDKFYIFKDILFSFLCSTQTGQCRLVVRESGDSLLIRSAQARGGLSFKEWTPNLNVAARLKILTFYFSCFIIWLWLLKKIIYQETLLCSLSSQTFWTYHIFLQIFLLGSEHHCAKDPPGIACTIIIIIVILHVINSFFQGFNMLKKTPFRITPHFYLDVVLNGHGTIFSTALFHRSPSDWFRRIGWKITIHAVSII